MASSFTQAASARSWADVARVGATAGLAAEPHQADVVVEEEGPALAAGVAATAQVIQWLNEEFSDYSDSDDDDDDAVKEMPSKAPVSAAAATSSPAGGMYARARRFRGEVLVMLGHYGWIAALEAVEHPGAEKNGGRIYVRACDVAPGAPALQAGDIVTFEVYLDAQGLGAKDCCLERSPGVRFNPDAAEFVPQGAAITAEKTTVTSGFAGKTLRAAAPEFVPPGTPASTSQLRPSAASFVPGALQEAVAGQVIQWLNEEFSDYSDSDDDDEDNVEEAQGRGRVAGAPRKAGSEPSDVSTSEGESSDPESEPGVAVSLKAPFRPPPGLTLPEGFAPPPGLSLP